jgi:hypothetical protein
LEPEFVTKPPLGRLRVKYEDKIDLAHKVATTDFDVRKVELSGYTIALIIQIVKLPITI